MRHDEQIIAALEELGCATTQEIRDYIQVRFYPDLPVVNTYARTFEALEKWGIITCLGRVHDRGHAFRWRLRA